MLSEELHTRTRIPPSLRIVCTCMYIVHNSKNGNDNGDNSDVNNNDKSEHILYMFNDI